MLLIFVQVATTIKTADCVEEFCVKDGQVVGAGGQVLVTVVRDKAAAAAAAADVPTTKRVRLSFPPDKYADLETISSSYMTDVQTPRLTYR